MDAKIKSFILILELVFAGCATSPPKDRSNVCSIFQENEDWYKASLDAEKNWEVPIPIQMAIINQESAFVQDARPPRRWFLGFIPLSRPSSAYGYSQALDGTWSRYISKTGNNGASRDSFEDAVDFIGWYTNQTENELGIPKTDAYRQYLVYHEGQNGYRNKSYYAKPWLMDVAHKVSSTASRYKKQLKTCQSSLDQDL